MQPGTIVDNRFRIDAQAGEGGMGVVYRAEEIATGKTVAIKVLHSATSTDQARFLREAHVLSSLSYPSIVACLGHGLLRIGEPWIAMEWVEGEDLATRLKRGPLPPHDALVIVRAIAGALDVAHSQGIVHRDVKPANIILEGGDPARARLIDFGIAHVRSERTLTEIGTVLGTPAYMAPEQMRGANEAGEPADLYALGVILFECVTGFLPFDSTSFIGIMTQALFERAPRLRDINPALSPSLDELVDSLLEKEPSQRLGPAHVLVEALNAADLDLVVSTLTPRSPNAGLTEEELRFVSVVFVAGEPLRATSNSADTIVDRTEGQLVRSIERLATPFHGRVEGLRNGTVLIAFPGRGMATDQAVMAARTALAIRDLGTGLPIALATGRSSANVGSLYSDAAVRAATLTKTCTADDTGVPIDETTRGLLDTRFSVEQRHKMFFLLAEDPFGDAGRLLCGRPAPFVGREREIALIEKIFDDVVHEPQSAVVIVVGEAGAGKSRLSREALATLSRIEPNTEIWVARGEAVRAGGSFGMLASALLRASGIRDGEHMEVRHQKLATFVRQRVDSNESAAIITFLGEMTETKTEEDNDELRAARRDPVLMRDRIRFAFEDLVDSVTEKHPLVLLLEDLHWGDRPTVKVLSTAFRRLSSRPFFVLALGRPEMLELFPNLFAEWSPSTMRLAGLSRRACQNLVSRILGDQATTAMIASIVDRSAGHPLFLEELVRVVAEASSPGTNALPETVLAMVQSRVTNLPPEARRVLRAASIFGETFWHDGVAKLLGSTELANDVEAWLRVLRDRELVEIKRASRFPSQTEYGFRHALFREAAHAMLTDADKMTGHLLAATFLEEQGETNAQLLAAHFDQAHAPHRAAPYYLRAAREALLGEDLDAVFRSADHVIQSGAVGTLLGEALAIKAEAMQWRGLYEQSLQLAESAIAQLEAGSTSWFVAITTLAMNSVRRIQLDKLRQICQTLATWGEQHEWNDAFVESAIRVGIQAYIGGQYDAAQTLIKPLARLLENASPCEPRTQAFLELLAAVQASRAWQYDVTIKHFFKAAQLFQQVGDLRSAAGQRLDATFTLVDLGQSEKAVEVCKEIIVIADRLSIPRLHSIAKAKLGAAILLKNRVDEALDVLLDAKTRLDKLGDNRNGGNVRYKIGCCYRLRKEFNVAETVLDESENMLAGLPRLRAMCHANKALLYLDMDRNTEALDQATNGMKLLAELGRLGTDEILVRNA
jgi:tetratricopeptide (TPR) repeat protein